MANTHRAGPQRPEPRRRSTDREAGGSTTAIDPLWTALREQADALAREEPALATLAHTAILAHDHFADAVAARIAQKLGSPDLPTLLLRDMAAEAFENDARLDLAARADLGAVVQRDPACRAALEPLLYLKGYLALQAHRVAHWYWSQGRQGVARLIQMRVSEVLAVDIHPGARIGKGIMMDHATGVVIGETAEVGDGVSMLHGVTLGGTGKESEDRHPKIGRSVLIGAGASILGAIRIGDCSRVAAGSVVLKEVPPCTTVAGVPAKVVGEAGCPEPGMEMDHLYGQ
ncbi:MAG: serine O-acetyltransferase [Pseudomonadota bacterium]